MEIQKPRQWILQNKPQGLPVLDRGHKGTFALVTATLPQLGENQVLVKPVYLSNDPAQQVWMSMSTADYHPERAYAPPIEVGDPIASFAIAEVVESQCARLSPGSLVYGRVSWSDLAIIDEKDCFFTLESPTEEGLSITQRMGSLGLSGLTAYYGLYDIVNATANDSIVISGAAGAVGIMAVQIAKRIIECKYVIGIAGTDEKCRFVENLGADVCLNYRSSSFEADLQEATKDCIDIYFDNVGGRILDMMLKRLKAQGRVAACGAIANYSNDDSQLGLANYVDVVTMRLKILGFNVADYIHKSAEVSETLLQAWKEGKIVLGDETETVFESRLEEVPHTWLKIFKGGNKGKMITKVI